MTPLKDKPVATYCTGGIRCEVLSGLMKSRGFGEVYHLDGGIVRYGEAYGDHGPWDGSIHIFDQRMSVDVGTNASVIGRCAVCAEPTKNMLNCRGLSCREQLAVCEACRGISADLHVACPCFLPLTRTRASVAQRAIVAPTVSREVRVPNDVAASKPDPQEAMGRGTTCSEKQNTQHDARGSGTA